MCSATCVAVGNTFQRMDCDSMTGRATVHLFALKSRTTFTVVHSEGHIFLSVTGYGCICQMQRDVFGCLTVGRRDGRNSFPVVLGLEHLSRGKLPSHNSEKDKKPPPPPPPPLSETRVCRLSHKPPDGLHLFSVCHFTINDADSRLITPRPRGPSAASEPPSPHQLSCFVRRGKKKPKFPFQYSFYFTLPP